MAKKYLSLQVKNLSSYLGLDLVYFVRGGFWLSLSSALVAIGGIFLSALFARTLTKEVFGQFSFLISILGFASLIALPGMSQAVIQAAAENKDGVYKKAILAVAKWSLAGAVILTLLSVYYYFAGNRSLSLGILLSALALPVSAAANLYNSFLTGKKQFKLVAIYGAMAQFASIGSTAFALWKFPSLVSVALFSAWSTALANLVLTLISSKYVLNNSQDDHLLRLGIHLSFSQVFTIGADYLDRFLVPILLGFTNNAIYSFAILIPMQIHGFLKVFTTLGQPKVARLDSKNLKTALVAKSLQLETLVAMITFFYIVAAPTIFRLLYPGYTGEAVLLSQIFSISLLYYPGNILMLLFLKERQTKPIFRINILYALSTIVFLAILVPFFGLIGAILAKISVRFLQLSIQVAFFAKLKTENV